jgi:hypothetical protein
MIGESGVGHIKVMIDKVAPTEARVLIIADPTEPEKNW